MGKLHGPLSRLPLPPQPSWDDREPENPFDIEQVRVARKRRIAKRGS